MARAPFCNSYRPPKNHRVMKRLRLILVILTMVAGWSMAQEVQFVETTQVQQALQEYQARYENNPEVPGYRIQYLFTTDRREMENIERKFDQIYGYIPHEWEHDQPYYRLYAGSFSSRSHAMKILAQIRSEFPSALLVNAPVSVDKVLECREKLNE